MKRSGVVTGIGGGTSVMDGQSSGDTSLDETINACAKDFYETFLKGTKLDYEGCDAGLHTSGLTLIVGIEPSYAGDPIKFAAIQKRKENSYLTTGIARGSYGTEWQSNSCKYTDYKYKSKFVRFVDKWHPRLFKEDTTS